MKKVFLEDLPKRGEYINWKKSIGYKVKFIYDDVKGEVKIVDYKNSYLTIIYNKKEFKIQTTSFKNCMLGNLLDKKTKEFKIEIGITFKDEKRDITIIDREYRIDKNKQNHKYYKYRCNKCGNEDWMEESNLLHHKKGCNVCGISPKKVLLGVNTIWDKAKWMISLGVSEEDAKKYMPQSNKKIEVICPNCGKHKVKSINKIYRNKSIGCSCGDGKSYPEKLIYYVLKQTEEYFETEYSPEYLKGKRNDFYLPKYNIVIESDGELGHKGGKTHGNSKYTLEELIEVDKWKEEQNLKHGIKTIRINCFKSELEYIKQNILNSELTKYIDFSNIDWNKCEEYALKNIVKEVCDYWHEHREVNGEYITTTTITKVFNRSITPIRSYLKKGTELGWCDYNSKEEMIINCKNNFKNSGNPIFMYDKNMNFIGEYESATWLQKHSLEDFNTYLDRHRIGDVCKGKISSYKGFIFKYKE